MPRLHPDRERLTDTRDLADVVGWMRRHYSTPYDVIAATATHSSNGWSVDTTIRATPTSTDEAVNLDQWDPAAIDSLTTGGDLAVEAFALILHANLIEWWDTERPKTSTRY